MTVTTALHFSSKLGIVTKTHTYNPLVDIEINTVFLLVDAKSVRMSCNLKGYY